MGGGPAAVRRAAGPAPQGVPRADVSASPLDESTKGTLAMYPNHAARELGVLLRISQEIDVVGDVTAIVANPSELLAWASTLADPTVVAWQATDSGRRYVQVTAAHRHAPIRGRVTAVLHCEHHPEFWRELTVGRDVGSGRQVSLTLKDLSRAWDVMPVAPPTA